MTDPVIQVITPQIRLITQEHILRFFVDVIEQAGRVCYRSEPNGDTAGFIRKRIKDGHTSILEHGSATFEIICDRSTSHQIVRHRVGIVFSQESQRYCNYGGEPLQVICPPRIGLKAGIYSLRAWGWVNEKGEALNPLLNQQQLEWLECIAHTQKNYNHLLEGDIPAEDSRSVLTNATKTKLYMTANFRALRHLFELRALDRKAQWQFRELMQAALAEMTYYVCEVFRDQYDRLLELRSSDAKEVKVDEDKDATQTEGSIVKAEGGATEEGMEGVL